MAQQSAPDRLDINGNPVAPQPSEVSLTLTGGQHIQAGPQTFNDTPVAPERLDAHGEPVAALPEDWKAKLAAVMESAAHPKTLDDLAGLMLAAFGMNPQAGEAAAVAGKAIAPVVAPVAQAVSDAYAAVPVRSIVSGALDLVGRTIQHPMRTAGLPLRIAARAIGKTPAAVADVAPAVAEAAPVAAEAAPVAATAPMSAPAGPIYHSEPTMQNAFAQKAAERKAAADAMVETAKKATKAPTSPVLGKNIVAIKNGLPDLTPAELVQSLKWSQEGVTPDKIIERINAFREMRADPNFMDLPLHPEAQAEVRARPHYIKYPKKAK